MRKLVVACEVSNWYHDCRLIKHSDKYFAILRSFFVSVKQVDLGDVSLFLHHLLEKAAEVFSEFPEAAVLFC